MASLKSFKEWFQRTLSDGAKPSMARQLLIPLTATLIYVTVVGKELTDGFTEIYMSIVFWAGGGTALHRWSSNGKDNSNENSG